ncbi:MAG: SBBP repeat-containing protein, partial [Blastocatellia bacterium]
ANYLTGGDPARWVVNAPSYERVRYNDLYPGIDLIYYGNQGRLEYDLVVKPGADPSRLRLSVAGARSLRLLANGDLLLRTAAGEARFQRPVIYQVINGERREVDGRYIRRGRREIGFEIGAYDRSRELVIDPLLLYASLFGGAQDDAINAIAVDRDGAAYVTGVALSPDFPTTPTSFQRIYNGGDTDVFVLKLNPDGAARFYATYLGGGSDDTGFGIAVDDAGNAYVTGATTSSGFPTTQGAYRRTIASLTGSDAFVTKLNPTGAGLVYSTYLGGADDTRPDDAGLAIAVDAAGNAYVAGRMHSFDFPTTPGAFQRGAFRGDDGFVTKFNPSGSGLVYSTLVAGNGDDVVTAIVLDAAGNAYLTGRTNAADFPTTPGAFQRDFSVGHDAFVLKLNPAGSAAVYSTYLAANRDESGKAIAVDANGHVYVTGQTASTNFPTTQGSFQPSSAISDDVFVTKLNAAGSALVYSTYIGGGGSDSGNGIAIDSAGNAYVVGETVSNDFPTTPNAFQTSFRSSSEAFVTKLNSTGSTLLYSTYLTGTAVDRAMGVALDRTGRIYVAGFSEGSDLPRTSGAYGTTGGTAFIIRMSLTTPASVNAASFTGSSLAGESIVAAFGVGLATGTAVATTLPLPTTLAGTRVTLRDRTGTERAAPLFFVSPGQINFQIPPGTAAGIANLTIVSGDGSIAAGTAQIASVAPGMFSANSDGQGVASGVALRIKADGSQSFEPISQFDSGQNKFVAVPIDLGPDTDQVFLILFGTGIRMRGSLASVTASVGAENAEVLFAGPQGDFVGLDQINLRVPRGLAGRGQVEIRLTVEGQTTNALSAAIR